MDNKISPQLALALKKLAELDNKQPYKLTSSQIQYIHDESVRVFGGSYGIRDNDLFESVCISPYQSTFGVDAYPDIVDKAAKYLFDFTNYQVFIDGNKRTGLSVCFVFLYLNGFVLNLTPKQSYFLSIDIANHVYNSPQALSTFLRKNIVFIENDI